MLIRKTKRSRALSAYIVLLASLFFHISAKSQQFASQAPPAIELAELLRVFAFPTGANYNLLPWETGATTNSGVNWLHSGVKPTEQRDGQTYAFTRKGVTSVLIDGRSAYEVLERTVKPGKWHVYMFGARAGVSIVKISSVVNSPMLERFDFEKYFAKKGYQVNLRRCQRESMSFGNSLFTLKSQGINTLLVLHEWSCGSGGCSQTFTLVSPADAKEFATSIRCA